MKTADKKHLLPIVGAVLLAVSPHLFRLPSWIVIWCLAFWAYVLAASKNNWYRPGRTILLILTFGGFIGGFATYNFKFSLDTGVGLLAVMLGLKPFEMHTHRDRMITLFLVYFLVITNLFYSNDVVMSLFMFASVLLATAVLIRINHPRDPKENIQEITDLYVLLRYARGGDENALKKFKELVKKFDLKRIAD